MDKVNHLLESSVSVKDLALAYFFFLPFTMAVLFIIIRHHTDPLKKQLQEISDKLDKQ